MKRRGFSFTEILFAIMILGIGFIMVAAMFPVAIQQTETSKAESVGAQLARAGAAYVQQEIAPTQFYQVDPKANPTAPKLCVLRPTITFSPTEWTDQDIYLAIQSGSTVDLTTSLPSYTTPGTYVVPGEVWDFMPISNTSFGSEPVAAIVSGQGFLKDVSNLSSVLSGLASENMVQSSDARFAWIAFYKRDMIETVTPSAGGAVTRTLAYAPSAQLIILAVADRTGPAYVTTAPSSAGQPLMEVPVVPNNPTPPQVIPQPPSLQASRSTVTSPATISVPDASHLDAGITFSDSVQMARAAEGAFVIIAADHPARVLLSNQFRGLLNGRIYRLGAQDSTGRWSFAPGFGPSASDLDTMRKTNNRQFLVYLVGRGQNPDNTNINAPPGSFYGGLAQDIAAYSTFISCPAD